VRVRAGRGVASDPGGEMPHAVWREAGTGTGDERVYLAASLDETPLRGVVSTSRRN
jgi:hypothetical protein